MLLAKIGKSVKTVEGLDLYDWYEKTMLLLTRHLPRGPDPRWSWLQVRPRPLRER